MIFFGYFLLSIVGWIGPSISQPRQSSNPYPYYGKSGNVNNAEFRRGRIAAPHPQPVPSEPVRRRFTQTGQSSLATNSRNSGDNNRPYPFYGKSGNRSPSPTNTPRATKNGKVSSSRKSGSRRGSQRGKPDNRSNRRGNNRNNNNNNNNRNNGNSARPNVKNGLDLTKIPIIGDIIEPGIADGFLGSFKELGKEISIKNVVLGLFGDRLGLGGGLIDAGGDGGDIDETDWFPEEELGGDGDGGDFEFESWEEVDWPDDNEWEWETDTEGGGEDDLEGKPGDSNTDAGEETNLKPKVPEDLLPDETTKNKNTENGTNKQTGEDDDEWDWGDDGWEEWTTDEKRSITNSGGGSEKGVVKLVLSGPRKVETRDSELENDYNFYYFQDDSDVVYKTSG